MPPRVPGQPSSRRTQSKKSSARPAVVALDWRLPARLRRPVHQELARQRRRQRQREAIVRFERRPLYAPSDLPGRPAGRPPVNSATVRPRVGVEQHTADVYQAGRPLLVAGVPPYAGSFLRGKAPVRLPAPPLVRPTPPRATKVTALAGERDVPYQWATPSASPPAGLAVRAPRRGFALPLHLSVWPFKRGVKQPVTASKKKVQNNGFLTL